MKELICVTSQVLFPSARRDPAAAQFYIGCRCEIDPIVHYTNLSREGCCYSSQKPKTQKLSDHALISCQKGIPIYEIYLQLSGLISKWTFYAQFIFSALEDADFFVYFSSCNARPTCGLIWSIITHFTKIESNSCQLHTGPLGSTGLRYFERAQREQRQPNPRD